MVSAETCQSSRSAAGRCRNGDQRPFPQFDQALYLTDLCHMYWLSKTFYINYFAENGSVIIAPEDVEFHKRMGLIT